MKEKTINRLFAITVVAGAIAFCWWSLRCEMRYHGEQERDKLLCLYLFMFPVIAALVWFMYWLDKEQNKL